MSSAALNWAFEKVVPRLRDQVEKLVILRLADRADPAGICWPGHNRTARDLNVSTRSIQRSVQKLANLGLIRVEERAGNSSRLHLQLSAELPTNHLKKVKKKGGDITSPLQTADGGDTMSSQGRHHVTPGGDTVSPKPLIESKKKPPPKTNDASVVVVVRGEEEKETGSLHWPAWMDHGRRTACAKAISGSHRQQSLLDELSGQLRQVTNPAAWLRRLVQLDTDGMLELEHAPSVAANRAARAAAAARESETVVSIVRTTPSTPAPPTPAQLAGRLAARLQLASLRPPKVTSPVT